MGTLSLCCLAHNVIPLDTFYLSPNQMLPDIYQVITHITHEAAFFGGESGELDPFFIDDLISLALHLDS